MSSSAGLLPSSTQPSKGTPLLSQDIPQLSQDIPLPNRAIQQSRNTEHLLLRTAGFLDPFESFQLNCGRCMRML